MDRKIKQQMRILFLYLFILTIAVSSCNQSQPKSPHEQFRGLYKLFIIESKDSTGHWQEYSWNKGGESYIMYDGMGHMAVQITPKDYKNKGFKEK